MSSEEKENQSNQPNQDGQQTYYARKKNWFGGVDNDYINLLLTCGVGVIASIAAYPIVKSGFDSLWSMINQQKYAMQYQQTYGVPPPRLPNGEYYIPPTQPQQPQTQPVQPTNNEQTTMEQTVQPTNEQQEQPQQQQPQQGQGQQGQQQVEDDGQFWEGELRKKKDLYNATRRQRPPRYDSPFGAHVGGLG